MCYFYEKRINAEFETLDVMFSLIFFVRFYIGPQESCLFFFFFLILKKVLCSLPNNTWIVFSGSQCKIREPHSGQIFLFPRKRKQNICGTFIDKSKYVIKHVKIPPNITKYRVYVVNNRESVHKAYT